jgi:hypothetical protein
LLADEFGLLAGDPPHQLVFAREAVGVLDRELGLADAAHAVQGLDRRASLGAQAVAQLVEHAVAAGEGRVAAGQVPHWRQGSGWPLARIRPGRSVVVPPGVGRCRGQWRDGAPHGVEQSGDGFGRRQGEHVGDHDRRPQPVGQRDVVDVNRDESGGRGPGGVASAGSSTRRWCIASDPGRRVTTAPASDSPRASARCMACMKFVPAGQSMLSNSVS